MWQRGNINYGSFLPFLVRDLKEFSSDVVPPLTFQRTNECEIFLDTSTIVLPYSRSVIKVSSEPCISIVTTIVIHSWTRTRMQDTRCTSSRETSSTASRAPVTCWRKVRARWGECGKRGDAPCRRRATSISATRTRTSRPREWTCWPARSSWCRMTSAASIS